MSFIHLKSRRVSPLPPPHKLLYIYYILCLLYWYVYRLYNFSKYKWKKKPQRSWKWFVFNSLNNICNVLYSFKILVILVLKANCELYNEDLKSIPKDEDLSKFIIKIKQQNMRAVWWISLHNWLVMNVIVGTIFGEASRASQ